MRAIRHPWGKWRLVKIVGTLLRVAAAMTAARWSAMKWPSASTTRPPCSRPSKSMAASISASLRTGATIGSTPNPSRGSFKRTQEIRIRGTVRIVHGCGLPDPRRDLLDHLQPLAGHCRLVSLEPRDIAARPRQACNKAFADRVTDGRKHDRDGAGLSLQRRRRRCAEREDNVGMKLDQLLCEYPYSIDVVIAPTLINPQIAANRPAQPRHFLDEGGKPGLVFRIALRRSHQHADPPHAGRLLRPRREWPSDAAAEPRDEIPPSHQRLLLDDLGGTQQRRGRHLDAERLRGLEIEDGLKFGWSLHR